MPGDGRRMRSISARWRAADSSRSAARRAAPRRPRRPPAGPARPGSRPRSSAGNGERQRTPVRTASTPTLGPPHIRASPASTDQPAGSVGVPEGLGGVDDQRHAPSRARPTGCSVPTSWLAACSAPAATPGRRSGGHEGVGVDPGQRVDPIDTAAAPALGRVQHGAVLDRAVHERRRAAVAGQRAEHGGVQGLRAVRGEADLVRPGADAVGDRLAGGVEQQPGPAARAVQPGRVGPAVVERGEQRLRAPPGAAAPRTPRRESAQSTTVHDTTVAADPDPGGARHGPVGSEPIDKRARGGCDVRS